MKSVNIFKEVQIEDFLHLKKQFLSQYYDMSKTHAFCFRAGPNASEISDLLNPLRQPISNENALKIQKELKELIKEKDLAKARILMQLYRVHRSNFAQYSIKTINL